MSEYQYYEFRAVEQQLTNQQKTALREISSRAQITSSSFVNEYSYGDLKAEETDLMAEYFDLGFYIANWGEVRLYIKLPRNLISEHILRQFEWDDVIEHETRNDQTIITLSMPEHEEYFGYIDDAYEHLDQLGAIREELINGDYRSLQIAWFALLSLNGTDEFEEIPLFKQGNINSDFHQLTPAQKYLADLFLVKPQWLTLMRQRAPEHANEKTKTTATQTNKENWITQLPKSEKDNLLLMLLAGKATQAQHQLQNQYKKSNRQAEPQVLQLSINELHQSYQTASEVYAREQQALAKQQARIAQKKHNDYLHDIYKNAFRYWNLATFHADKKTAGGYDEATRLFNDLHDAYHLNNNQVKFQKKFSEFIAANSNKPSLMKRLKQRGLLT
ncbi:hypothetical protein SG34_024995 [Thalassomonas viridans]|uniref:Uncharacterized protein n=1 Tax=Thalassomonas viridans TaxID=137584 RepID=A0AAE9Z1K2_9GAMM|nr:hypothetical protein [Thalassomonas viridans]WDE04552.1 hypothetical protein SG34_024995 [Thalassomonas viridans]